jgi:hypothetical protein
VQCSLPLEAVTVVRVADADSLNLTLSACLHSVVEAERQALLSWRSTSVSCQGTVDEAVEDVKEDGSEDHGQDRASRVKHCGLLLPASTAVRLPRPSGVAHRPA